jgi:hypothetical protein
MYRVALVLIISLLGVDTARAADDPKALIERARRATGDTCAPKSSAAIFLRARGTLKVGSPRTLLTIENYCSWFAHYFPHFPGL